MSKPWEKYSGEMGKNSPNSPVAGPWAKYQSAEAAEPNLFESNSAEAFGVGALQGLLLDHGDELMGAVESPKGAAKAIFGYGSEDPDVKKYHRERDTAREAFAETGKQHPVADFAGRVTGTVVGPGKVMKGLKGAKAVVAAGGLGAATGEGSSTADLADKEYGRMALDTAIGAGIGMVMQHGANKLGDKLAKKVPTWEGDVVETTVTGGNPPPPPPGGTPGGVEKMKRWANQILGEGKPVENADEVASAIKDISGKEKVPGYLLTRDVPTQNLASTLLKQPTIGGKMTRAEVMPIYEGLEKFGKAVADRASGLSAHDTGAAVKKGIGERFKMMIAPAEQVYETLETKFAKTPLEGLAFKRGISKLRNQFKTDFRGGSQRLLDQLEGTFSEIKTVQELRAFRTNLGQYLEGTASPAEKQIIGTMYGVLTRERDRSILRSAVTTGPKIARAGKNLKLLEDLKGADKVYREAVTSTADALGVSGNKNVPTSTAIREYLAETPAEQVVKDLFNKGDIAALSKLSQYAPEEFKLLKDHAVAELVNASKERGTVSAQRLVTNLQKYPPEVQKILMGDLMPKAKSAGLTLDALPRNFNPSDTSTRMEYSRMLSPDWWADNARSLGQRKILTGRTAPSSTVAPGTTAASSGVPSQTTVMTKLTRKPGAEKYVKQLQDAATRGDAAWASTYYVLSKTVPAFRAMLEDDDAQ